MAEDATPAPSVRPSYLRCLAEGPNAGRWTTDFAEDPRNVPYPNFGCASQHNLAVMVDNARDLKRPQDEDPRSGERRNVTWSAYVGNASGGGDGGGNADASKKPAAPPAKK